MDDIVNFSQIKEKLLIIRGQHVLLDSDVAYLYGVETKRVNEAVRNNPNKFPEGFIFDLQSTEKQQPVENFDRFKGLKHSTVTPVAFTEKGLYMLATILKGEKATQTTIEIVETFAKVRELSRAVSELSNSPDEDRRKALMQKSGEIIADVLGNDLKTTGTETTFEINFALMKLKHTVKRS
ncbi:MAG: ORF6N domain-containing protein [Prevotellaceae bacterium]|jgi:hypothetical protein|nr:ORF6N domain-containing protein [Prevotellaceae bacterium]